MKNEKIVIKGGNENNLKNISLEIPKYKLIAVTGVSGSGKSSFAIDILQKECQRQYLESMGMVTDGLNKPNVDSITGLSPSISIGQRKLSNNPRSTVGTYTEIFTYLRILYAKLATRKCPHCNNLILPNFSNDEEVDFDDIVCGNCKNELPHLSMATFSFNKTKGACPKCNGIGIIKNIDYTKLIDENLTIKEGAIKIWNNEVFSKHYSDVYEACGKHYGFVFDVTKPVKDFNKLERLVLFEGVDSEKFKKLFPNTKRPKRVMDGYVEGLHTFVNKKLVESNTKKISNITISSAIVDQQCNECNGSRLGFDGRTATLNGKTIVEVSAFSMIELLQYINQLQETMSTAAASISNVVIVDLLKRINGIIKIGLDYLSIDRTVSSLSGGESQRLRLTSILESGLTGVLYILDEPTTGLHPKDTSLLLSSIKKLRDLGNTIIVIEHDMDFVRKCDHVIDFGPDAGIFGGEVVANGTIEDVMSNSDSKTAQYLRKVKGKPNDIKIDAKNNISVINAFAYNLKNITVDIPLGQFVSFAGVSGSGKSTLLFNVLEKKQQVKTINGLDYVQDIIKIDQKPIGRQSRSNVATYTDVFLLVRQLFASLPDAKKHKLKANDFSFNVKGGRCPKCEGLGVISLDMQFLDDIEVICPVCNGQRFKNNILSIEYKGKNISDILNMTILENINFFKDNKEILKKLDTINEVGLSYLTLGQSTTTLSGGECQRLKLSKELSKSKTTHTLYLLDEPTTGLHPEDTKRLIKLLKKLVSNNNSVFVIEHSTEVISQSDYVIELGPLGGINGGTIISCGTPYEVSINPNSVTGKYL